MKDRFLLVTGLFVLVLFAGCEKDFSVNAEYEDFPIVLGLLNASDDTHYIKVYKSFITEHNAYDAAKDIHLYSYIDSVEVYMEERDGKNALIRKILFDTTTEIPKDPGIFDFPTQIIYKTHTELNADYNYQLFVYNRFTNKMAYSQPVPLVGDVTIRRPTSTYITITDRQFTIEYLSAPNAYMYEFSIQFYYSEKMRDNTIRQGNPIEWYIGRQVAVPNATGFISYSLASGANFYQRIGTGIVDDEHVVARYTDSIVFSVFSAGRDWYLYLLATMPTSGINQHRLDYSNISAYNMENDEEKYALGLFSSRAVTSKMFRDLTFPSSRDSLFYGRYTKHLKFTDIY